jgi:hypothetical protein
MDTRAEGQIHSRRVKKMVRAFSPPNPTFPSTQAVGLGWYSAAPSVLSGAQDVPLLKKSIFS